MKKSKLYLIVLFICISNIVIGQEFKKKDIQLEKSMYNVHIGLINTSVSNESRLIGQLSLKSELIFHAGYIYSKFFNLNAFGLLPSINIEPRYYYNRQRRLSLNKDLHNNAGNFIGLRVEYIQGEALFSNYLNQHESISIVPVYGLKRNFTDRSRFSYEFAVGVGLKHRFIKKYRRNRGTIHLNIGIGYRL